MSSHDSGYTFVLWSQYFHELETVLFVTELREAGFLVKVVGLDARQVTGAHGVSILPDLTLSKALPQASQAKCVIVPCGSSKNRHLKNDPRVSKFMSLAQDNQAKFVVGPLSDPTNLGIIPNDVMVYPAGEALMGFVRGLAGELTTLNDVEAY